MNVNYPNGKSYQGLGKGRKNHPEKKLMYSNRGMTLEEDINETNKYYLSHNIAVIHKKPTPVQIVNVDYPKRSAAIIKEAYFKQASTTDYNGVYKGRYIDFEAKETKNKTSFPLQNFHDHQISHMKQVVNQQGICFILIRFSSFDEIYLLETKVLFDYWYEKMNGGKKSIPKKVIEKYGYLIPIRYFPRIDYLSVVDKIYS